MDSRTGKLVALLSEIDVVAEHAEKAGFPELGTGIRVVGAAILMGLETELIVALAPLVEQAAKRSDAWLELGLESSEKDGDEEPS
jgi:hypothetical protein